MKDILIVGGGIGGLTLALFLHKAGIPCRVYECVNTIKPIGMGINLLPYATEKLAQLGILDKLRAVSIETRESVFCNRFGQTIFSRPAGRLAGNKYPQLSIHRGELHNVLLSEVYKCIGAERVYMGWNCTNVLQFENYVTAKFTDPQGKLYPDQQGSLLIGCDGVNSAVRKLLYPDEGAPLYRGINMWRGVSQWVPFFSGASMVRIGLPNSGKLVIYPIKDNIGENGTQLINWVIEIETANYSAQDWNQSGHVLDFINYFSDWKFDWLDVPEILKAHRGKILKYPMMDRDPVSKWSFGMISLLGDAAHPMVPLGSNGAGQAILDASFLQQCIIKYGHSNLALKKYEDTRLLQTARITKIDRSMAQDRLLHEVYSRTNDSRILSIDSILSKDELIKLSEPTYNYIEAS